MYLQLGTKYGNLCLDEESNQEKYERTQQVQWWVDCFQVSIDLGEMRDPYKADR